MPTDRAKMSLQTVWKRQRDESGRKRKPLPPLPPRDTEIEAIERFAAERGITKLPTAEKPATSTSRGNPGDPGMRPMAGWRS